MDVLVFHPPLFLRGLFESHELSLLMPILDLKRLAMSDVTKARTRFVQFVVSSYNTKDSTEINYLNVYEIVIW